MKEFNKDDLIKVEAHEVLGAVTSVNLFCTAPLINIRHNRFTFHYDKNFASEWSYFAADSKGAFLAEKRTDGWFMDITELAQVFVIHKGFRHIKRLDCSIMVKDLLGGFA